MRRRVKRLMSEDVGVLRRGEYLVRAVKELRETYNDLRFGCAGPPEYELLNLLTVATLVAKSALLREESRGAHLRDDFSAVDDEHWRRHITLRLPPHEREEGVIGKVARP